MVTSLLWEGRKTRHGDQVDVRVHRVQDVHPMIFQNEAGRYVASRAVQSLRANEQLGWAGLGMRHEARTVACRQGWSLLCIHSWTGACRSLIWGLIVFFRCEFVEGGSGMTTLLIGWDDGRGEGGQWTWYTLFVDEVLGGGV